MTVRLAVIGAGRWGRIFIRNLVNDKNGRLTVLVSSNPKAPSFTPSGCRVEANWQTAIRSADIDGVIIATPPHTHAAIATAALEAQKAVLIEKPLTISEFEARTLLNTADRLDGFCLVDHTHLYQDAFCELQRRIQDQPNEPLQIHAIAGNDGPIRRDTPVLWDWGAHDVAMCLAITGSTPTRVSARCLNRDHKTGGEGQSWSIELEFSDSTSARIEISNMRTNKCRRFSVTQRSDAYIYDDLTSPKLWHRQADGQKSPIATDPTQPITRIVEKFIAGIKAGTADRSDLRLGLDVVSTLATCEAVAEYATDLAAVRSLAC